MKSLSRVRPSATPWTAAHQAPPSMGFSRQEYWSGVPVPSAALPEVRVKMRTEGLKIPQGWWARGEERAQNSEQEEWGAAGRRCAS